MTSSKPCIAIYVQHYLTVSMTFIYRQMACLQDQYNIIVLTTNTDNLELFPHHSIYQARKSFFARLGNKLCRVVCKQHPTISKQQHECFRQALLKHNVKLIHAHFGPAAIDILPLAKSLNIPLVVTFHGYDISSLLRNKTYVASLKNVFAYAHVVAISSEMQNKLVALGANPKKLTLNYIGTSFELFKYHVRTPIIEKVVNNETIIFSQVANFVEKKGHKYTLLAFKEFAKQHPNCILVLAGAGPLLKFSINLANKLDLSDKVIFIGRVTTPEVMNILQNSDCFLHHSVTAKNGDREGLPTSIMEAMATGLPIISTIHAGIPELVRDGIDGYLVKERDLESYTNKMQQILTFREQDTQYWLRKEFDIGINCKKLSELYRSLA